jgi:chitinase
MNKQITGLSLILPLFILPGIASAAVIFEDNFDAQANWTINPNSMTDKTDGSSGTCYTPAAACATPPPTNWTGWRVEGPASPTLHNTLTIDATNKRGASGKGLTVWIQANSPTASAWTSDSLLVKYLGADYNELYIRYWQQFSPSWQWWSGAQSPEEKFFRVTHYWDKRTDDPYNVMSQMHPMMLFQMAKWAGGTSNASAMPEFRYETTYYPTEATPPGVDNAAVYYGTGNYSGTGPEWNTANLPGDGQWHRWDFHVKLNSAPGVADGVFEIFIDGGDTHGNAGTPFYRKTDLAWSDQGSANSPRKGWNMNILGGNAYNFYSAYAEQWYAFDDVVVSTTPLPDNYVIGGGTSDRVAPAAPSGLSVK